MKYLDAKGIDSAIVSACKSTAVFADNIQRILVSTLKRAATDGDCSQYTKLVSSLIEAHPGKRLPHSVKPIIAWVANNATICNVENDKPREFKVKMVGNWKRKAAGIDWKLAEETLWLDSSTKRAKPKPELSKLQARALSAAKAAVDENLIERTPEAIHSFVTKIENDLLRELGLFAESAKEIEAEAKKTAEIKAQINVSNDDLRRAA